MPENPDNLPGSERQVHPTAEYRPDDDGGNIWHECPGLTAREHAAIELRVPDCETEWINKMIRRANSRDAAVQITGVLVRAAVTHEVDDYTPGAVASDAVRFAQALLAELDREGEANNE